MDRFHNKRSFKFVAFYLSVFCLFGQNMVTTAVMPAYMVSLGGSVAFAGIINAVFIGVAILLRIVFAQAIDRRGSFAVLIMGAVAFTLTEPLLILTTAPVPAAAVRIIQALGLAAYMPACSAYVARYAPPARLGLYLGLQRISVAASTMVGPALAFPLAGFAGFPTLFAVLAAVAVVGLFTGLIARPAPAAPAVHAAGRNPFRDLPALRSVAAPLVMQFLVSLCYASVFFYGQPYMADSLPQVNEGLIFTLISIGCLASGVLVGKITDKYGPPMGFIVSFAALTGAFILFILTGSLPLLVAAALACGLGYYGSEISAIAHVAEHAAEGHRGLAITMQQNCLDLGLMAGSVTFGLVGVTGPHAAMLFSALAAIMLVCTLYWIKVRRRNP
jgi:MFS family permease